MSISQAKFSLTSEESSRIQGFQNARFVGLLRSQYWLRMAFVLMIITVPILWYAVNDDSNTEQVTADRFLVGAGGYFVGFFSAWFTTLLAARRLRSLVLLNSEQTWRPARIVELDEGGIRQDTAMGGKSVAWSAVTHVEHLPDYVHVWTGPLLAISIPTRAFASEAGAAAFVAEARNRLETANGT